MTHDELQVKLIPGDTTKLTPNDCWYPSGQCDGVIFRVPKKRYVNANGILQEVTYKKNEKTSAWFQKQALRYLRRASIEDRTTVCGIVHSVGIHTHLGGITDILATHNPCLKKEKDAGFVLDHYAAHDKIGASFMLPEVLAYLKVIPVEDGIYAVIYDPESEIV